VDNPLEADLETLDFNIALKPDYAWSSILYPYPETEIGKLAIRKGFLEADFKGYLVSNKSISSLKFNNSRLQRKLNNLHKLFGIIVQFPVLRGMTDFLISLPLTQFYTFCYFALYGYNVIWKNLSWKSRMKMMKTYIAFYFKYVPTLERKKIPSKNFLGHP
jgi:hypothetical protein